MRDEELSDGVLFSPNAVTMQNLAVLASREAHIAEARLLEIADAAHAAAVLSHSLTERGMDIYEILALLADGASFPMGEVPPDTLRTEQGRISAFLRMLSLWDRASFAALYAEEMRACGIALRASLFLPDVPSGNRFVYVHNPLSDEAYEVFTASRTDARAAYVASWQEACRAVAGGEYDYCLLPLEERGGVRLPAAAGLIFRYDLRIVGVTPVFGFAGDADMKYAMLAAHGSVPQMEDGDDGYLEIRMRADDPLALTGLLNAATIFGVTLYRVHTTVFDTEEGAVPYYSVLFREDGGDFAVLLTYLTLFTGSYTPVGIYKNLE